MKKLLSVFALATSLALSMMAAEIPRKAPDITVALPGGKQAKLSDYRGNVVIVTFILTTCPHCQKTTQVLSGIEKDLGSQGLRIFEGAMDEGADIPGFIQNFQPNFPVGAVDRMSAAAYMQLSPMVRTFLPYMLFIDRNGTIQAQYTGGDDFLKDEASQDKNIRGEVLKMLAEPGAKQAHKKTK